MLEERRDSARERQDFNNGMSFEGFESNACLTSMCAKNIPDW